MTDRAPRWLVRWMQTVGLLVVLAGVGVVIYRQLTAADRFERALRAENCRFAWAVATAQTNARATEALTSSATWLCATAAAEPYD